MSAPDAEGLLQRQRRLEPGWLVAELDRRYPLDPLEATVAWRDEAGGEAVAEAERFAADVEQAVQAAVG